MKKLLVALLLFPVPLFAGTVTLSWIPPTECSDGSPISFCPITGYEVQRATSAAGPWTSVETVAPTLTTKAYTNIAPGTHFYRLLTAAGSLRSLPSNVASKTVDPSTPNPPTALSAN